MKTLSSKLLLVLAIGVTAMVAFATKPPSIDKAKVKRNYNGKKLKPEYQDLQKFQALLDKNEAIYCLRVRDDGGKETPLDNGGCKTTGQTAVDDATRDLSFACFSSHVTQTAGFNSPALATNVDGAFQ